MKKPSSLSFHVTVWLAVAVAIGMGAYAVLEYLTSPGMTVLGLLVHHGWHVLTLGAVFYGVSWLAINRLVVRPLNAVYLHLYAIGGGERSALLLPSNVAEIELIVEGINLMLLRLESTQYAPLRSRLDLGSNAPIPERLEALAASIEGAAPLAPVHVEGELPAFLRDTLRPRLG